MKVKSESDSAGSGATEEGLTSRGGRNLRLPLCFGSDHRVPAELGQESQASSCVEELNPAGGQSQTLHCGAP